MVTGLWSKVKGRFGTSGIFGAADLKKITDSGVLEVPEELLSTAIEASHDADSRKLIMTHLREVLADGAGKNWRRIHAALILSENVMTKGSPLLANETAEGHHFDLVQRLAFLEHFQFDSDKRAQGMVRSKAANVRGKVITVLQNAGDSLKAEEDTISTCSPGESIPSVSTSKSTSNFVGNTTGPASAGTEDEPWHGVALPTPNTMGPKRQVILNGIVAVGHNDDTTDESSGEESAPVRYREEQKNRKAEKNRRRRTSSSSSDSDGSAGRRAPRPAHKKQADTPTPQFSAQTCVNLLDL